MPLCHVCVDVFHVCRELFFSRVFLAYFVMALVWPWACSA